MADHPRLQAAHWLPSSWKQLHAKGAAHRCHHARSDAVEALWASDASCTTAIVRELMARQLGEAGHSLRPAVSEHINATGLWCSAINFPRFRRVCDAGCVQLKLTIKFATSSEQSVDSRKWLTLAHIWSSWFHSNKQAVIWNVRLKLESLLL